MLEDFRTNIIKSIRIRIIIPFPALLVCPIEKKKQTRQVKGQLSGTQSFNYLKYLLEQNVYKYVFVTHAGTIMTMLQNPLCKPCAYCGVPQIPGRQSLVTYCSIRRWLLWYVVEESICSTRWQLLNLELIILSNWSCWIPHLPCFVIPSQ